MIYEHFRSLIFFYLMSSSTGCTIQTHLFYSLIMYIWFVDIIENKSVG